MSSGSVILSFHPTSVLLGLEVKRKPGPSTIVFELRPARRQTITTTAGEDLAKLDWSLQLNRHGALSDRPEHIENVGVMMFLDSGPGSCFIKVAVEEPTFDRLLAALQVGRMPREISVEVKGLAYGHDLDGRDKVWDIKANDYAPVTEVSFILPVGKSQSTSDLESAGDPQETASHIDAAMAEFRSDLKGVRRSISMAVWLLVIIVILVAWELMSR